MGLVIFKFKIYGRYMDKIYKKNTTKYQLRKVKKFKLIMGIPDRYRNSIFLNVRIECK